MQLQSQCKFTFFMCHGMRNVIWIFQAIEKVIEEKRNLYEIPIAITHDFQNN